MEPDCSIPGSEEPTAVSEGHKAYSRAQQVLA
jgi:hypothetical protein